MTIYNQVPKQFDLRHIYSGLNSHFEWYRNTDSMSQEGLSEPRTRIDILKGSVDEIRLYMKISHFMDHSWKGYNKYMCKTVVKKWKPI